MNDNSDFTRQPPKAPPIQRRLRLYSFQIVGFLLMFAVPVLALFGVFGESYETLSASGESINLEVHYATRFRYKMINPIQVTLHNTSVEAIDTMTIHFDRRYIDRFSAVTFTPSAQVITGTTYDVQLDDIPAGETRRVDVQLQGEHYGRHQGMIRVETNGQATAQVTLSTFIFP